MFTPRNLPTMEWDTAAGHSILKNAGGNIYTRNGLELEIMVKQT